MQGSARSSGVLLHVTSLPSGRLDEDAYRFVDWLVEAGQSWWQLLPLHIPDEHGSPYASRSAFAGFEGLLAPPGSPHLRQRRGRGRRARGSVARGVGDVRGRGRAARADALPARVAGAEALRERARDPADRRHPALRRGRLVRRRPRTRTCSTARWSRARRRRSTTRRASAGGCRSSTGPPTPPTASPGGSPGSSASSSCSTCSASTTSAASRSSGSCRSTRSIRATASGARGRASRSSTRPASGSAGYR